MIGFYAAGAMGSSGDVVEGEMRAAVTVPAQPESMASFPVYIDLSTMPAGFWSNRPFKDGRDVRVKDGGGSDIPMHLVSIDVGGQTGSLFAKVSLSGSGSTTLYVHWGDSALSRVPDSAANGAYAVWSDYHRVFLFNMLEQDFAGSDAPVTRNGRIKYFEKTGERPGLTEHQGVCWDGTYYYLTDTNEINKYDADWNLVATNSDPVGDVGNGTNHCGDPDMHAGVLYVPVENYVNIDTFSNQRIARFNASDLTFIDSVDVSAQGDEVASIAIDPHDNALYTCEYRSAFAVTVQRYNLTTLAYVGSTLYATPNGSRIQGLNLWRGALFANADQPDYTLRLGSLANPAVRMWTDIPDGSSTRSGNYEGLGATDSELLVLRDDGTSSVLHFIKPLNVEAGGGVELVSSPDGVGIFVAGVTNLSAFTMGVSVAANAVGATNQAVVSYTAAQTANTNRVTIGCRSASGKWGVWDTGNTWMESISDASTAKTRLHARYDGTSSRSLFVNGTREGHATPISAAPSGKVTLRLGAEDLSFNEPCHGKFAFAYLRASVLSDAWIAAECGNLADPGSFYSVGSAEPV